MTNLSRAPLAIHSGVRVCQIVLERTEGEAVYSGRYVDQVAP
jgi:deoxycytidine triphosphate deaminase